MLEIVKAMDAKIDDLTARLVSVERKVDDLSNKVQGSQKLKRKVTVHKPAPMETEN